MSHVFPEKRIRFSGTCSRGGMTDTEDQARPKFAPFHALRRSMSAQVLAMAVVFVLFAELIVLIPSIAKHRIDWFQQRLEQAYLVDVILENPKNGNIDSETTKRLFGTAGIVGVIYKTSAGPQQTFMPDYQWMRYKVTLPVDLSRRSPLVLISEAWATFFSHGENIVRVIGMPRFAAGGSVEMFVSQSAMRDELHKYALSIFGLSLIISTLTAALFYFTADFLFVRPVRCLTHNMARFNANPEEPSSVVSLSSRQDEIGAAERALREMETRVQDLLTQRRRLAALGAGISKISHDLRNILASAQLMSDRLARSDDPRVRQLSPRLVQALDRAVALSRDTLSYGRMEPRALKKTKFNLSDLIDEILDDAAHMAVDIVNDTPLDLMIEADRTHLYRAVLNLVRNAVEAIAPAAEPVAANGEWPAPHPPRGSVTISARSEGGKVAIDIADTGPGLPAHALEKLFEPFHGSGKPGGSGLGVAIAYEVARAHGGGLALTKNDASGATFTLELPAAA